jgi:hypothetical protein
VVIVSWNAKRYLEECLDSLAEAPLAGDMEIIVVDNGSTDGSPEMVASKFPSVRLIRTGTNLGFAKANNVGIRETSGRYIALVNSDIRILGKCLDDLMKFLDQNPRVGVVGPKILNADMSLQSSCRRFPSLWNNFCESVGLAGLFGKSRLFAGEHMLYFPHNRIVDVNVLVGCFWLVRRETFDQVGLLDEDFFIYSEDVDWCKRCWDIGWRVTLFPTPKAIHYRGGSSSSSPIRFSQEQQRATLHYWEKHGGTIGRNGIFVLLLLKYVTRYIATIVSSLWKSSEECASRMQICSGCLKSLVCGSWKSR